MGEKAGPAAVEPLRVTVRDIEAARDAVREVACRTPTVRFPGSEGDEVFLKLENLQRLGAFKIRGAWNRMSRMTDAERRRGVATISSGNHGLAVAWSARRPERSSFSIGQWRLVSSTVKVTSSTACETAVRSAIAASSRSTALSTARLPAPSLQPFANVALDGQATPSRFM